MISLIGWVVAFNSLCVFRQKREAISDYGMLTQWGFNKIITTVTIIITTTIIIIIPLLLSQCNINMQYH